jgi:hypothetical protein
LRPTIAPYKPRIERPCDGGCGLVLSLPPSESGRRYCSQACRKGHKIRHECKKCGIEIVSNLCLSKKLRKYCSYSCYRTANGWQDQPRKKHPDSRPCVVCGTTIQRPRHSVDRSWSLRIACTAECRKRWNKIKPLTLTCVHCGSTAEGKGRKPKRFWCSYLCKLKSGALKVPPRSVSNLNNQAFRDEYGTACLVCGYDRCIDYAHIIPHRQGGTAHPDNIMALCPNHHRLFDAGKLTDDELGKVAVRVEMARNSPSSRDLRRAEVHRPDLVI